MYLRGRFATCTVIFLCAVAIVLVATYTSPTSAQTSGRRAATADDLKWLVWAGFENPTVGMTIDPNNPYIGQAPSEAKMWLAEHTKLHKSRIICLNPLFAQKLKNLMENVPGGPPEITSGYRTIREQEAAMRSGHSRVSNACNGYHLYGLAADFNNNNGQQTNWMRAHASQYGIRTIGNWDPNHFQDGSGRSGQCGACNAEGLGDTSSGGGGGFGAGSPTAGFAESLRQWIAPPPAQPAIPSQPAQSISQSQNPLESFSENDAENEIGGVSSQINTGAISSGSSTAADRLEELAFGPKPATTTATSVPLVVSGSNAAILSGTPQNAQTTSVTPNQGMSAPSQTTFVSGDLSWQSGISTQGPLTGWDAIFVTIRATLNRILALITPFGGFAEDGE
jgi:hypothetical protein